MHSILFFRLESNCCYCTDLCFTSVTYFVGAGYGLAAFFYFMIRGQEYQLLGLSASLFVRAFYRHAKKTDFDVDTFNALVEEKCKTEEALRSLRDPHRLLLPKVTICLCSRMSILLSVSPFLTLVKIKRSSL